MVILEEKIKEFKKTLHKEKEIITAKEFREKFCNDCYWRTWGKCDIKIVGITYCVHALMDAWKYKLIYKDS